MAVFGLPLTLATARIFEAPSGLLGWLRLCASLGAIGLIVMARRSNLAQRLLLAFVLEAVSGVATFAYVDVPFVTQHSFRIASGVASGYARLTQRNLQADLRALPIAP